MREIKPLNPGDNISLRIPVNTPERILGYINQPRTVNRNKHLSNLLFSKIEEELNENSTSINITLPFPVTNEQKNIIKEHLKSLFQVFAQENNHSSKDTGLTNLEQWDNLVEWDEDE